MKILCRLMKMSELKADGHRPHFRTPFSCQPTPFSEWREWMFASDVRVAVSARHRHGLTSSRAEFLIL